MKFPISTWVKRWLFWSAMLVIYDSGYVLLRPLSLPGGLLYPIFSPYEFYGTVDLVYSEARYKTGDRFCEAQAMCNVVEVVLQLVALRMLGTRGKEAAGLILAFTTQSFTFWKTILYWLYDAASGFANTGHNDWVTVFFVYVLTNVWWIVLPLFAMVDLGMIMWQCLQRFPPVTPVKVQR